MTTGDKSQLLAKNPGTQFSNARSSAIKIEVDPSKRFQTMVGFGASITDASAWLIRNKLSEVQRNALMAELFGRGPEGVGFEFTRLTIGASDFSLHHYTLNDTPENKPDPALHYFSIEPNRQDLLPVVKQALAINPKLQIMGSPWSAPAWMKTNKSLIKGALHPDHYDAFSRYLVRYVDAYAAEGIPITTLTLQNEPHFEPNDYPGMRLNPPARAKVIGEHLGPLLKRRGLKTQIIDWDHNWDEPKSPLEVLADPVANPYIAGVAWHCYAGDVKVQAQVHAAFPDKDAWFTECSGGEWKPHWPETLPWLTRNIVIGATRGWAKGVLMWNMALDENYGPHLGGCKDCRGMVTINSKTGEVTRNMEYYALAHASKFVRQGAQRIESTTEISDIETVAFQNADDRSIALIVCNSAAAPRTLAIAWAGKTFEYTIPRESVATFLWPTAQ